ncbi:hypothetical protein RhiXN_03777 [Rhizoctonia solani]|uniref:Fungal-type protein kinase domain-containing protein n=1 Tax=Rhizoctonia solani TaxID=456999 RepID=A0A8H8SRI2_9AGAM|nr:uncharacterized protein RhiXN_03777 [Rhizoctonia solani]QRW15776.1 hypothetical protein RhiXN_03777 [Rhizoctonia solani]
MKEANTLQEYVEGRYPSEKSIGRLYDMELSVFNDRLEADVRASGTVAFMSSQLLSEEPVQHTFMHDLDSLLWVLVWLVAVRAQEDNQHNANSLREEVYSSDDSFKYSFVNISERARSQMARIIDLADTEWEHT